MPGFSPSLADYRVEQEFIHDPSLVLYLPLYKHAGAVISDESHLGHLCTVTGALWRPNGRYFNGSTNKIEIPASAKQFDFTSEDFTIIAQIYPEDIQLLSQICPFWNRTNNNNYLSFYFFLFGSPFRSNYFKSIC